MLKKQFKVLLSTFIVGVIFGTITSVVLAATATSNPGYYGPINCYSYVNSATVTNDNTLYASARVNNQALGNIPTGYMSVKARLYKSTTLCAASDPFYNPSPANGISANTAIGGPDCGAGTYNSKGLTEAYNGNGYDLYSTFVSPNITQ
jgi:hypothetical protein